jgi:anti-anti-sigma factor
MTTSASFTLHPERGGHSVLAITGELDMDNSGALDRELAAATSAGRLTVDLTGVVFLDSAAIAVFFEHAGKAALRLVLGADATVSTAIVTTGLDQCATVVHAG